ncbi:MAG: Amuc_1102 family pilus-like protein [Chthoniobacteraceae bacterium]
MKKHLLLLPLLLSLVSLASAQVPAAPQKGDVAINNNGILPTGVKTPEYMLSSGPIKRSKSLTWLEIEVQYATAPVLIDELTFEYSILMNGQLLTGTSTYVNIAKGREHYAVVYISPAAIDTIMGGLPFTASALQNVQVRVTHQGQELDTRALRSAALPNVQQRTGIILNKPETPFAPLFWDRYETLKPLGH